MRLPVILWPTSVVLLISACANDAGPEIKTETLQLQAGQSVVVDSATSTFPPPQISAIENGYLFVHSEISSQRSDMSDASGIKKIYVFIPDKSVVAAKSGATTITKSDGLRVFEYSKNDASPDDYCFQKLSEGEISAHIAGGRLAIAAHLKTPPVIEPTDARCDSSEFVGSMSFSVTLPVKRTRP